MLPTKQIEFFLEQVTPELRDIVLELRNLVAAITPDAVEVMHRNGMTYYHGLMNDRVAVELPSHRRRGGPVSAGICQIHIERDHVRLAFIHGAFLPEPRGLLEGPARYKKYIRIHSYEDAPWDYLKELIQASSHFDPYTQSMR